MIYVASPYTNSNTKLMHERYVAVSIFCVAMAKKGNPVFSPIVHWHPLAVEYSLPRDAKWWRRLNKAYLINSKQLWILKLVGWENSMGIAGELDLALEYGIYIKSFKEGDY